MSGSCAKSRTLTAADDSVLGDRHVLICDRDAKWSAVVRARLGEAGIRMVQTPYQAPNARDAFISQTLVRPFLMTGPY